MNLMSLSEDIASQWRHVLLVFYLAVMLAVFLLPVPATPLAEWRYIDKLMHFGIFLGFALVLHVDQHWRAWRTFLLSVAFAGGIELVQWTLPYREAEWLDFVAGAAGAALGTVLVLLFGRQVGYLATRSAERSEVPKSSP
jgi:VanZ family protein